MFIIKLYRNPLLVFLASIFLFCFSALSIFAQVIPGANDRPQQGGAVNVVEEGAPVDDNGEVILERDVKVTGPVAVTSELETARDDLWDIILGETITGSIARVLDGNNVDVLLSGIMEIGGETVLYVGVDNDDWEDNTKRNRIKEAFKSDLFGVPIIIEGTEGVFHSQSSPSPLTFSRSPSSLIPDDTDTQSVTSVISVPNNVNIGSISVSVDITHTHRGDLKVDLVSPNGTVTTLHDQTGGGEDNIDEVYINELSGLIGTGAQGNWTLRVGDYAGLDFGTLDSWTLTVTPQSTSPSTLTFSRSPSSSIPDDTDTQSVTSVISVPNNVNIGSISVSVDITHTHRGDLKVDLVSPNGTVTTLHDQTGGGEDNIDEVYINELSGLIGTGAQGNWTLRVGDYAGLDFGTLDSWTLTIVTHQAASPPTPSPSQNTCRNSPNRNTPIGGDRLLIRSVQGNGTDEGCGTITLGGVKTKDGKKGFVTAAHSISRSYDDTNKLVGHRLVGGIVRHALGKVDDTPLVVDIELLASNPGRELFAFSDSAFVEYPQTNSCGISWRDGANRYCFQHTYLDRVGSLQVRGDNAVYTVTGSRAPADNLNVTIYGATTRTELDGQTHRSVGQGSNFRDGALLTKSNGKFLYSYLIDNMASFPTIGDSGAPVYTRPNATSNNVEIVGVFSGVAIVSGNTYALFSGWDDVKKNLDLASI